MLGYASAALPVVYCAQPVVYRADGQTTCRLERRIVRDTNDGSIMNLQMAERGRASSQNYLWARE
jgi:hypothetical protein